jgi:VWFA-related protein
MRAQNAMQPLATTTGGSAFVPERTENLQAVFSRIESELRAQYLLQYYSNNQSSGAAFRHIVVSLPTHQQLRVRTREGYYPKQK